MLRPILLFLLPAFLAQAAVPTPESFFHHPIGVDRQLLDWSTVVAYFQALGNSSDKIRVTTFGTTGLGRPMIVAAIAAPDTLQHLDHYREIQLRLADPRTTPAEARALASEGKNVVLITCSIHADEVASTHSAVEFAYRLLTEKNPRFAQILANDILLLAPSINPDGVDIITRWYRQTLGTPFEGTDPPELYNKYVGHDNNRDWYIFSQPETRAVIGELQNKWHPEIVYDVHQQSANAGRMFMPPWLDPIEPNVDPILAQEMNMVGTSMATDMTAQGFSGITINSTYDFWTPARAYQSFHGGLRILTESASAKLATPVDIEFRDLSRDTLGYDAQERSWNYLEPWPGGHWTLRNIVNYQEAAFESCLYQAAIHREEMIRNFRAIVMKAVNRQSPAAYVIPAHPPDPGATRRLLETLAFGQIEIDRAPNGDHVISLRQPWSDWAKALLEHQHYPDLRMYPGGPPRRPYDVTAHTLPLLFGVEAEPVDQMPAGPLTLEHYDLFAPAPRALKATDTDTWFTINAIWNSGGKVFRNPNTGDFASAPQDGFTPLERPRVGLYRSFVPAIDEGWTRWLFDHFGFSYSELGNAEIAKGNLRAHFDVLVFADQSASTIQNGFSKGRMPDEYTGGLGEPGAQALQAFAQLGGVLVFLNRASDYAIQALHLPVKNAVQDLPNTEFYAPGALLNVDLRPSPLTLGLPERIAIWSEQSPAFEAITGSIAVYPQAGILASGWLLGPEAIAHRSALVDIPVGRGHVILFGMRPQYRAQSYQTFKLFFNALVYQRSALP